MRRVDAACCSEQRLSEGPSDKKYYHHRERRGLCSAAICTVEMGIIMKQRKKTSVFLRVSSVALAVALLITSGTTAFAGKTFAESIDFKEQIKLDDVIYNNNYFGDYVKENKDKFSDVPEGTEIKLDINSYSASEGDAPESKTLEGKENVLFIPNTNKSVSWEITVEKAGFYQFYFDYLPVDGNTLPVTKGLQIDGEYLYDELSNIKFVRHYVDSEEPRTNNLGDHTRPNQQENQEWTQTALYDAQGEYSTPLKVALTEGAHTITMVHIDQPLAIAAMSLTAPEQLKSYAEVKKEYEAKGYKNASRAIRFEAEGKDNIVYKTDSAIIIDSQSDSTLTPKSVTSRKFNIIGGEAWAIGNQEIAWSFEVEETGLYQLAPRFYQEYGNGFSSTRQIKIDGKVPFEELNEYVFYFEDGWHTKAFKDKDGSPYLLYLEKGKHTISMRVVYGQMTEVIHLLTDVTSKMSNAYRNITMVTGQSPDVNYDYDLEKQITSLIPDMTSIASKLRECVERINSYTTKTTTIANNLNITIELVDNFISNPEQIPSKLGRFSSSITNIGSWIGEIKTHSLAIDFIRFTSPDEDVVDEKETLWNAFYGMFLNFILSYSKDYSAIGSLNENNEEYETIEVWVSKGREMCEILKDLIDTDFVTKYKTNVKLNILPPGQIGSAGGPLLLSINAGTQPDIVVDIGAGVPFDYAFRDAFYDISKFEDFEEVKKPFNSECFVQLSYEGGVYALPETVSFRALFVRTDIFDQLGLKVPNSWDELVEDLIPQLNSYNMQVGIPSLPIINIYQNGGQIFSEHVYSALLDTPEAIKGFEANTKLFTDYGVPISYSGLNRFRSGEIPIIFEDFQFYKTLAFSAPELTGKWKMYPIPGTYRTDENGETIFDRTSADLQGSCSSMLAGIEEELLDNAWDFMKWYTSAETQIEYVRRVETVLGIAARWIPANKEAFEQLSWTTDEREVINESFKWARETPPGLGAYLYGREINFAFNRVVISGTQTVREALEQADETVDKEMRRKQIMYGVNPEGIELD
ncbi:MAG: extracellular solute-binding protein [Oscillospiraceae bacterium]|nr:extracellular solute-binding protein [Oscillospiraceae bacterium]